MTVLTREAVRGTLMGRIGLTNSLTELISASSKESLLGIKNRWNE
jgi:hypothetical protein